MADIAMDLYSLTAVLIKLNNKSISFTGAEKEALKRFTKITKERIKENLNCLKIDNEDDLADTRVADLWIKEAEANKNLWSRLVMLL